MIVSFFVSSHSNLVLVNMQEVDSFELTSVHTMQNGVIASVLDLSSILNHLHMMYERCSKLL